MPGFLDGVPGLWWTINGRMYPDVPMYMVAEGDVVRMRVENRSGEGHPMHLHGHHAVVLARDGVPATGARGGRLTARSGTARPTTSRSWPTTPGCGWTTATTSRTPSKA